MKFICERYWEAKEGSDRYHLTRLTQGGWKLTAEVRITEEQLELVQGKPLGMTLEPVKSREERLREARNLALSNAGFVDSIRPSILHIIERADAEFAKGEK